MRRSEKKEELATPAVYTIGLSTCSSCGQKGAKFSSPTTHTACVVSTELWTHPLPIVGHMTTRGVTWPQERVTWPQEESHDHRRGSHDHKRGHIISRKGHMITRRGHKERSVNYKCNGALTTCRAGESGGMLPRKHWNLNAQFEEIANFVHTCNQSSQCLGENMHALLTKLSSASAQDAHLITFLSQFMLVLWMQ